MRQSSKSMKRRLGGRSVQNASLTLDVALTFEDAELIDGYSLASTFISGLPEGRVLTIGAASALSFEAEDGKGYTGAYSFGTAPGRDDAVPAVPINWSNGDEKRFYGHGPTSYITGLPEAQSDVHLNLLLAPDQISAGESVTVYVTGVFDIVYLELDT